MFVRLVMGLDSKNCVIDLTHECVYVYDLMQMVNGRHSYSAFLTLAELPRKVLACHWEKLEVQ